MTADEKVGPAARDYIERRGAKARSCLACGHSLVAAESYLGMEYHERCIGAEEEGRAAAPASRCGGCGAEIIERDYPAVYPWDSGCLCGQADDGLPPIDTGPFNERWFQRHQPDLRRQLDPRPLTQRAAGRGRIQQ